ncbi:CBS domain-containing protein [Saccharolobus islandicus]|uniref:CBS domain protein n=3 Tax=Saccharolobus islandicus TaxID=43080 RepID=M9UGX1_SACIS|nr:CBS domain-containing protein [Sulfolobus islandicus]ADX83902.1 putative signal-transduction protein with CBS domains [Sulfolobus islandicus HVE10/4]ADX86554.1 putative signal-transduction protein with CBS domains [Sulfolobus islandicus REY15A]AGJ63896.1 CBS domain protein [Sulfolobus islandicus LAL14/1]WCM37405.1 CBS domain-containing protein [Sulfolobus islandicus]
MKLKDVFNNTRPIKITRHTSLSEALELMDKQGIRFALVIDNSKGDDVIGIVTRSIILRSLAKGVSQNEPVSKVMIKNVITINGEEDLIDTFMFMMRNNITHLLAINETGKIIGVVSMRDVLTAINKECEKDID